MSNKSRGGPRFPMPPRRAEKPVGASGRALAPDDLDKTADALGVAVARLRDTATAWRDDSAGPDTTYARLRACMAITGPVLDASQAINRLADLVKGGL